MRLLLTALLLAALATPALAQPDAHKRAAPEASAAPRGGDALNATLLGQLDERDSYGDIWGYVDPSTGREYALLTSQSQGLSVIDLDGPTPVEVGFIPDLEVDFGPFSFSADSKDVKTYGQYAYLVHELADILVIDLADPTDPQVVSRLEVQPGNTGGSHNVLVEGDYLYVVGGRSPGGLRIYDLAASPTAPPLVGTYEPTYFHDLDVVGDVAYAAAIYDEGVFVLDLRDRANPREIGVFTYPTSGTMGAHNVCATADGNTVFVGDEIGSEPWTRAFDVSEVDAGDADLPDVELLSELIVDTRAAVHNCYVKGDFIYIAHYSEGLQVFDVSDPANPERAAFYDTYTGSGFGFNGAWTAYPFLPSGRVIVSDRQSGLLVIDVDVDGGTGGEVALTASATTPLTVAPGGSVSFSYTVSNDGADAVTGDLYFVAERNGSVVSQGPITSGTLPAGQSLSGTYTQRIPAGAAAGTYTYSLKIGSFPGAEIDAAVFTLTVTGPAATAASQPTWAVADATPWAPADPASARAGEAAAEVEVFPNPFSSEATLRFALPEAAEVRLAVYDVLGREVAVLVDGRLEAGPHAAMFDGRSLPSGVYAWRLVAAGAVQAGQLSLVR